MDNIVKLTISDLVLDFLYYERKEDTELPVGKIEQDIKDEKYTVDDIVNEFKKHLVLQLEKK